MMCRHELDNNNVSIYKMAEVTMRDIGDRFANKLIGTCVDKRKSANLGWDLLTF